MIRAASAIGVSLVLAAPIAARPDGDLCCQFDDRPRLAPGVDPSTGRDLWSYAPHPIVAFNHMRLEIDIPDMNTPRCSVVQHLTVRPVGDPVSTLTLDATLLEIASVSCAGHQTSFAHDGRTLTITFDPPLKKDRPVEIVTTYTVNDPPAGLTWTPESPAWPGRPAQIHSQGQARTNNYWFPCHDSPNVRLTTELVVTVPAGFLVSSNGRLVSQAPASGSSGKRTTFHWLQDKPHVPYLVSLIVGKFDVVDVAPKGAKIAMPVYVPPGRGGDVAATYGRTGAMVSLFERLTGQAYPWDRYAQLVVWNFGAGGMENTAATTMFDTAIFSREAILDGMDLDGLISHELAHQWYGDLITCRTWEHIWLNEGFATYFTNLWFESRDGKDAYFAGVRGNFDSVIGSDRVDAPVQRGMVSKDYREPWEMFRGAANPYPKGSSILHMLRTKLGDEVFYRGLAAYTAAHRLNTVETNDFRRVMEGISGENLDRFFRQWCERPGVPELDIAIDWDARASELVVRVKQLQRIDGDNPAFAFDLPIWTEAPASRTLIGRRAGVSARPIGVVSCDAREHTARFKLDEEPSVVAVDPEMAVLAKMTITQPPSRWIEQLGLGPTWAARAQAVRALALDSTPAASAALATLARDVKAERRLRAEAAKALAARKDMDAVIRLSSASGLPAEVQIALVEGATLLLGDTSVESNQRARLRDFIINRSGPENGARVRSEAVKALGSIKATDQMKLVLLASDTPSQNDMVRQAALEALAKLDTVDGMAVAIRYALPGTLNRTRPTAINTLASLARHDREAAYRILAGLLDDRESRAWRAAGAALVQLGDARATADFERAEQSRRDDRDKAELRAWARQLREKTAPR
jgi:aminopeptidase N